jgi:hypothetical protein
MDRVTQRFGGAESKDLKCAYPTYAVRPLSTTEARPADSPGDHQVAYRRESPVLGLGWPKSPEQHRRDKIVEVLRLRATSSVSRGKSVRRSAQDDECVGSLTKNTVHNLALMGRSPGSA